eukprot:XP_001692814.1 predicted protein [Chlamydomonas reinhardtii]
MNLEAKSVEQKLQVLTHQNQRLAVQLEEKRKASKALEDKVSALEQKESEYQQTLLCTGRLWSQFTDSITHLCANMAGFAELRPPPAAEKAPSVRDPFVQRLVSDALQVKPLLDSQKRIDAELSDVEQALVERSRTVKDALGTILDAVRSVHARQDELSAQLRSSAAAPAAAAASADASASAEALASENARLGNEASALRRELDGLRATASAAAEELRLSEGRRAEAEERIRQLQNELADTEQELSNALLAKRSSDLEKEKEAHARSRRELAEAAARVGDEAWVPSTRTYALMQQQAAALGEALAAERARGGSVKTVSELQALVGSLQAQVAGLQKRDKLEKASQERLDACAKEVVEAAAAAAKKDRELQRAKDKLRKRESEVEEARKREAALKEAIADLRAFVDVTTVYCNDPRDVVALRAAEQVLKSQVADLKQQLQAERLQREVAEAAGVREALERDLARLAGELAQAKEQLRAGTLKIEAASLEVKRREDALAALQQQLEGAARQVDLKRQALESLQGKVEKLKKAATPSGAARELQEEVDAMRQLLNCNVCHERQKNRIITKCCHVFCDVCIDRTLTARNRKVTLKPSSSPDSATAHCTIRVGDRSDV